MGKATVVFIQVPVSALPDVIQAIQRHAALMKRDSGYEYESGRTLTGDRLLHMANKLAGVAKRATKKHNRVVTSVKEVQP